MRPTLPHCMHGKTRFEEVGHVLGGSDRGAGLACLVEGGPASLDPKRTFVELIRERKTGAAAAAAAKFPPLHCG